MCTNPVQFPWEMLSSSSVKMEGHDEMTMSYYLKKAFTKYAHVGTLQLIPYASCEGCWRVKELARTGTPLCQVEACSAFSGLSSEEAAVPLSRSSNVLLLATNA
eukprot:scpid79765/ scgid9419/ 